jgi:hypothetical protein
MHEQQRLAEDKEAAAATATATANSQSAHARTKDAASKLLARASGRAVTAALWMKRACEAEQHALTHQGNLAAQTTEISKLEEVCCHIWLMRRDSWMHIALYCIASVTCTLEQRNCKLS